MNGRNALQEELMTTIKLTIEYDGTRYPGFSTKKKKRQYRIKAYSGDQDVTGQSTQLFAAVKTEPGVHAAHQIVSFQLEKRIFFRQYRTVKNEIKRSSSGGYCSHLAGNRR